MSAAPHTSGWFAVRDTGVRRVVEELRASYVMASRADIPQRFWLADLVTPKANWTLVVLEGATAEDRVPVAATPAWAQALSFRFGRPAVAFVVEPASMRAAVFDAGRALLTQEHLVGGSLTLVGDVHRASQLLGVDASAFGATAQAVPELARRLGLALPSEGVSGVRYMPSSFDTALAGPEWKGLPPRVPSP